MSRLAKEIFRRRVPHFLGAYLAAGWAALEFTDFLVNRYLLSPHLTDLALMTWGLLLPSIALLAWSHGAPGRDEWTKLEKIGIPVNLVAAAAVVFFNFAGKELGATTRSVTLSDETGQQIERTVPKREFRESLLTYYFDNVSGDTALDWLQWGIPAALNVDLEQDLFIDARAVRSVLGDLRAHGAPQGLGVSLALKRDLAERLNVEHFLSGELRSRDGALVVTTRLYETRRGKLVQERAFRGDDVFGLIDSMSVQLKRDLELPDQHIEGTRDLPISELLTSSLPAVRLFIDAIRAMVFDNDYTSAVAQLEEALDLDPEFALGHLVLFEAYFNLGDTEKAEAALEEVLGLLYKLPEPTQLEARTAYYWFIKQDVDRAKTAAEMRAELSPNDLDAHELLADIYTLELDRPRAIASHRRVLEIDPSRFGALRQIGDLYAAAGELDSAFAYLRRYVEERPDDPAALVALGDLLTLTADHAAAREQYVKATVVDPRDVTARLRLADLDRNLGDFEAALDGYQETLAAAATPEQRSEAYAALADYHMTRGQPARALEHVHARWNELRQFASPFTVLGQKLQQLGAYVAAGDTAAAQDSLASIAAQLTPPFDVLLPLGQLDVYLELENADSIEAALPGVERFIEAFGFETLQSLVHRARGRVFELRGDCGEAIVAYERALAVDARRIDLYENLGRCERQLGRLEEARAHLERVLETWPADPTAHVELGLVHAEAGEREAALEHLRAALRVWAEAESGFEPAREAREKLQELRGG